MYLLTEYFPKKMLLTAVGTLLLRGGSKLTLTVMDYLNVMLLMTNDVKNGRSISYTFLLSDVNVSYLQ